MINILHIKKQGNCFSIKYFYFHGQALPIIRNTYYQKKEYFGDFCVKNANGFVSYAQDKFRQPSQFVLLADSYCGDMSSSYFGMPYYYFSPMKIDSLTSGAGIQLFHQNRSNVGFVDGHAGTMNAQELYESPAKITHTFDQNGIPQNIEE